MKVTMIHTSPNPITAGTIHHNGAAGDCLFFSGDAYIMTAARKVYVYEAEFECVTAWNLADDEIVAEIARRFGCDEDLAQRLLDGREELLWQDFDADGEDQLWLQGKQGECAKKMGYDGCQSVDEQGVVYIVPMAGRESELKLIEEIN